MRVLAGDQGLVVVVDWIEVLTRCRFSVIVGVGVFDLSQVDRSLVTVAVSL